MKCYCIFFFFSSRRRHTRCSRDWSSDVCSSDLLVARDRRWSGERCPHTESRPPILAGKVRSSYRSEEHTSELQSRLHLVCRLLLEKKKKKKINIYLYTPPHPLPQLVYNKLYMNY